VEASADGVRSQMRSRVGSHVSRCFREDEVQIVCSYRSAPDRVEAGYSQHSRNVLDGNVAVPMKVREPAMPRARSPEVDRESSAARLQDPPYFSRALSPREADSLFLSMVLPTLTATADMS
jgi:hypothetical protein